MNPALPNSIRISRLKKRFLDVLSGSVKVDPRGAALFLEGLCAQDDPVVCLNAISNSAHGLVSVQSAMQFDLSVDFMNGIGLSVLEYFLARTSDVGGGALDTLLFHVVEPPVFWNPFVRTFQQGELSENAQLVFARLLSRLLTLQNRDTASYRAIAAQPSVQDSLLASPNREIREIGHLIKHLVSDPALATASDVLNGPGGRHDNDFPNYREISILPTADEILCQKPAFLRAAFHDELNASETPVEDYLDNTFRMLREDMLFDIRDGVETALLQNGKHHGRTIGITSMVGIYTGSDNRESRWGISLKCSANFKQLKNITDSDARIDFLKRDPRGSKIMRHQSLVCLAYGRDIISLGTINRVEELLACKPPVIVFQVDGAVNIRRALAALSTKKNLRLIQINAATFSFEPVLTALQKMRSIPLGREIMLLDEEKPVTVPRDKSALSYIAKLVASNLSIDLRRIMDLPTSIRLDKSQALSLVAGLSKRVSLIQGPPGTGKSFIGTILAKAIHDKTSETILVVCYTNHALDQFLEDLLKYGIPDESIVRLGGRQSQSTEHLSLRNQPRGRFQYDWDVINTSKAGASGNERRLKTHFDQLSRSKDADLINYLEQEHQEYFTAFHVPPVTEDDMILVGERGRAIDDEYLFSRWSRGQDAGVLSGEPHVQASARIWAMGHSARQQLLATWRHERVTKIVESMYKAGAAYNEECDTIRREFGKSTVSVLRQKRIIACTTTGAAIHAEAIKAVGPQVLLVEEAGEILEGHILTALSRNVHRMILVGDHKQLRPKVNNYQLTVERGEGFELNRSLFERLILKGYPHETLSTQHRMRPEISAFVRELTYPELVDAPSTHERPDICGVPSNIIFVDHSHPEDDNVLVADRTDGGSKSSKKNTYEVQMVLMIVRYLAQQGYKGEDIVVLTPYLGQLHQLRDALKRENDPILSELDSLDLARAGVGLSAFAEQRSKRGRIHLATIDNYQGEESDIVIASLTRSNKSNAIGFMDSPERLNVLLSRARNGLVLIGNSRTFLQSKTGGALWRRFFALLDKGSYVYQGFPVRCERHPERTELLTRPGDFDAHCPAGGCTEPCGVTLSCGHACPLKCHPPRSDAHDASRCRHRLSGKCPAGRHILEWQCRIGPPDACGVCQEEVERLAGLARQALERQRQREEVEMAHRRRLAELEVKMREEVVEGERKLQEVQTKQAEFARQEEAKRQQEECKKREEAERERAAREKKKEEKMARRKEKQKRKQEEKKKKGEKKKKEKKEKKQKEQKEQEKRQQEEKQKRREEKKKRRAEKKQIQNNGESKRVQGGTGVQKAADA